MSASRRWVTIVWWFVVPVNSSIIAIDVQRGLSKGDWSTAPFIPVLLLSIVIANCSKSYWDRKDREG